MATSGLATRTSLPATYEQARAALQKCARVDECKEWADKARAVATYAKMADDESLFRLATKIKARAIRRMGVLINEIKPARGGQRGNAAMGPRVPIGKTREIIAKAAGLSPAQRKQAQRISNLSEKEFEKAMDAPSGPATLKALANRGKKSKPRKPPSTAHLQGRDPAEYNAAIHLFGAMDRFIDQIGKVTPKAAIRGSSRRDYREIRQRIRKIAAWSKKLQAELEKKQ